MDMAALECSIIDRNLIDFYAFGEESLVDLLSRMIGKYWRVDRRLSKREKKKEN